MSTSHTDALEVLAAIDRSDTMAEAIDALRALDSGERIDATGNPRPLDNDRDPLNRGRCTRCGSPGCRCDALTGGDT